MTEQEALDLAAKAANWRRWLCAERWGERGELSSIRAHAKTILENAALKAENERLRVALLATGEAAATHCKNATELRKELELAKTTHSKGSTMTEQEALDMAARAAGWGDYNIALYNDGDVESIVAHAVTLRELAKLTASSKDATAAMQAALVSLEKRADYIAALKAENERLRRDKARLLGFAQAIQTWRSDADSYDKEWDNPQRNYCEDVELMEAEADLVIRQVEARTALERIDHGDR